jgi:hypothetical protein
MPGRRVSDSRNRKLSTMAVEFEISNENGVHTERDSQFNARFWQNVVERRWYDN